MRKKINFFYAVCFCLMATRASAAMKAEEQTALNQYINERKKITAAAAPVVDQLGKQATERLDAIEKRLVPVVVWLDQQSAEVVANEARIDKIMQEMKEQSNFNPYADEEWKANSRKDLKQLCCEIKADPRRQTQIQGRIAQGLPALPIPGAGLGRGAGQGPGQGFGPAGAPAPGGFNQTLGNRGKGGGGGGGGGRGGRRGGGGGGGGGKGKGRGKGGG